MSIVLLADFLPVFKVLDLAMGQVDQFHGKYGLKIVGGGPTYQSITDYSQEEQIKYNYQTTRSTIIFSLHLTVKPMSSSVILSGDRRSQSVNCTTHFLYVFKNTLKCRL